MPVTKSRITCLGRRRLWIAGLLTTQIFLGACSLQILRTEPISPPASTWQNHRTQMLALSNWHVKGKIGYKNIADAGSAWVDWCRQPDHFNLVLSGPLGAGAVQIFGNEHRVTLRQAEAADILASSATALSGELLGWELPVDELSFWIRGIPAPNLPAANQSFDKQGRLTGVQQGSWQLMFSKYSHTRVGSLPGKIIARQDKNRFTLIIKEHLFANSLHSSPNNRACGNQLDRDQPKFGHEAR